MVPADAVAWNADDIGTSQSRKSESLLRTMRRTFVQRFSISVLFPSEPSPSIGDSHDEASSNGDSGRPMVVLVRASSAW